MSAIRLLDRRCARAGMPRPRHMTPARWLGMVHERIVAALPVAAQAGDALAFVQAADLALYAPSFSEPIPMAPVKAAAAVWSWRHLAATRRPPA